MKKVWIIQVLCPSRHCIVAMAYDDEQHESRLLQVQSMVEQSLKLSALRPHCGICGAKRSHWIYESAETKFHSMEEAMEPLKKLAQAQRQTALALHLNGESYDSQKWREN